MTSAMVDPRFNKAFIMSDHYNDHKRKIDKGAIKGKKSYAISSLRDPVGDLAHHMMKIESFVTNVQGSIDDLT